MQSLEILQKQKKTPKPKFHMHISFVTHLCKCPLNLNGLNYTVSQGQCGSHNVVKFVKNYTLYVFDF